jgi:predicted Zn finger-like uncharacterized protein
MRLAGTRVARLVSLPEKDVALAMILTCPSCRTRYQADSARFVAPGRNVRCAKCGQVWFQSPAEQEPQSELEQVLAPPAAPDAVALAAAESAAEAAAPTDAVQSVEYRSSRSSSGTAAKPKPKSRRLRMPALSYVAGWAALIGIVAAIGWAGVQYRQTIASLWPESASLYAALGMPVNVRGMALVNVSYQQDFEDGQPVLSVSGKVVNISDRELAVPELRAVLTDDSMHELYHWTFDVGVPTLKAGAESSFITRLSSPPAEARNINIRFADSGETQ